MLKFTIQDAELLTTTLYAGTGGTGTTTGTGDTGTGGTGTGGGTGTTSQGETGGGTTGTGGGTGGGGKGGTGTGWGTTKAEGFLNAHVSSSKGTVTVYEQGGPIIYAGAAAAFHENPHHFLTGYDFATELEQGHYHLPGGA